jgi:aldehyde:ferredoxin oxidoreductase
MKAGERVTNLERCFNVLCGVRRKDDALPRRFMEPKKEGAVAGKVPEIEKMLDEYYKFRGWKPNGVPTREKLLELGLGGAAERIAKSV